APVSIEVSAERTTATVGDPVRLTFRIRRPADAAVVTFDADRSLDAMTLLDQQEAAPKTLPDGRVEETRVVTLAAYETGSKSLAPVRVVYRTADGKEGSVATAPVAVEVGSVLTAGQTNPADIKKPITLPERALWPWVLAGALVLAALLGYWLWRRSRRRPVEPEAPVIPVVPPRPAHEIAFAELERLLASGLLERGEVKKFYIELAEILRRYLGARFGIDTFDRTTWEILEELRRVRPPENVTTMAREFLDACDLVKFARHHPDQEETRRTVERAYRLIDETRAIAPAREPIAAAGGAR
ncbi:MAG TPA: hypothetical protein VJV75_13860, partial [Candidatus Polarisedimenticolia bacterium]|nr:hypothetical protein [Candidatus Polarisedimenticolia bacterium]